MGRKSRYCPIVGALTVPRLIHAELERRAMPPITFPSGTECPVLVRCVCVLVIDLIVGPVACSTDLDLHPRDASSPFRASSGSDNTGHRQDATPRKTRRRKQKDEGSPPSPSSSRDSLSSAPSAAAADGAL
jgi:hypothetical protein